MGDMPGNETKGVKTLLGDPKKAVIKLAIPMIIGMSVQALYNLTNAVWVGGKGPEALAAVGFFFAVNMIGISLAVGIGIGGGAAISRRIGQKKPVEANQVAVHTIIITLIATAAYMLPLLLFTEPIFRSLGASSSIGDTMTYARIMAMGTIFIFFSNVANAILRSEGDANRSTVALAFGAVLNIFLDPFFIYAWTWNLPFGIKLTLGMDMGVAGAAWASVLALAISSLILFYWLFIEKKTYVKFSFRDFSFSGPVMKEILVVGGPSTLSQLSMSIMFLFLTVILSVIGGDDGVAIYTTGWRVVSLAILPILGLGAAVTAISGAAFGAKDYDKLAIVHSYSFKIGLLIETVLAAIVFFTAPYIVKAFTWSTDSSRLNEPITTMLRIMWIFFPAVAGGILSSQLFLGIRQGFISLVLTIARTLIITVPLAALFGIAFRLNLIGVYIGVISGSWIVSVWGFTWARMHIQSLRGTLPAVAPAVVEA
jgi:putative MATE family efflux protein